MAVTNREIIAQECYDRGITEPVKTIPQWNKLGYRVKRGQHALFITKIWKPNVKVKVYVTVQDENGDAETMPVKRERMMLVNAGFFGLSQVEKARA